AAIDRHNSGLNVLAAKQALDMTNQDMRSAHGDLGQQINLLRLKMAMDQNEFNNLIKGLNLNLNLQRYNRGELVPPPKTPEQRARIETHRRRPRRNARRIGTSGRNGSRIPIIPISGAGHGSVATAVRDRPQHVAHNPTSP